MCPAEAFVEVHRRVDIGRTLHVQPEPGPGVRGDTGEGVQVAEARLRIDVEAQLGRLDRELGPACQGRGAVEQGAVVSGDLVRLRQLDQVLAEPCEDDALTAGRQARGRADGSLRILAGHEPADGTPREPEPRQVLAQPGVAGHPEQDRAHGQVLPRWFGRAILPRQRDLGWVPPRLAVGAVTNVGGRRHEWDVGGELRLDTTSRPGDRGSP